MPEWSSNPILSAFTFHAFMICIGAVFNFMQKLSQRLRLAVMTTHEFFLQPRMHAARVRKVTAEITDLRKRKDGGDASVQVKIRQKEESLKQELNIMEKQKLKRANSRMSVRPTLAEHAMRQKF